MKIGLLTYHAVSNFGANLQAYSTVSYFRNKGIEIEIINWQPEDLKNYYEKIVSSAQTQQHEDFLLKYLPVSKEMESLKEIDEYISQSNFDAIIIGSDAVFNYHPILTRIFLSRKTLIKYVRPSSDHCFPNPFWGEFNTNAKVIAMSVCAQALNFRRCLPFEKKQIRHALMNFDYISVRDRWAKQIVEKFAPEKEVLITPDPVFGFIGNCPDFKDDEVIHKYNLPTKYVIFSFCGTSYFSNEWFEELYHKFNIQGYKVVNLAMPEGCVGIKSDIRIDVPLSVRDWYNVIRLSSGYIGQRMHPMIVAMTNLVPIFIFDHYVIRGTNDLASSKIYDLLERANLLDYYWNLFSKKVPNAEYVFNRIINFDHRAEREFVNNYTQAYNAFMSKMCDIIIN